MKTITNGHGERIVFSATYKGKQIPDDQIIFENDTFTFVGEDLVIDFAQYSFCNFIIKGENCVIYSGHSCTFNVGDYTVIKCGSWSKFIVGDCCTVCCGADCIFSHDCPLGIDFGFKNDENTYWNRKLLTDICEKVQPKILIHGHYHKHYWMDLKMNYGNLRVIGLGRNGDDLDEQCIILEDGLVKFVQLNWFKKNEETC